MIRAAILCLALLAGCARSEPPAPLWLAERDVVHCYATIAAPDCYRETLPGAERRLIAAAPQLTFTPLPPAGD